MSSANAAPASSEVNDSDVMTLEKAKSCEFPKNLRNDIKIGYSFLIEEVERLSSVKKECKNCESSKKFAEELKEKVSELQTESLIADENKVKLEKALKLSEAEKAGLAYQLQLTCKQVSELTACVATLQNEVNTWKDTADARADASIAQLGNLNRICGETQTSLEESKKKIEEYKVDIGKLQEQCKLLQQQLDSKTAECVMLQKQAAEEEKASLNKQVKEKSDALGTAMAKEELQKLGLANADFTSKVKGLDKARNRVIAEIEKECAKIHELSNSAKNVEKLIDNTVKIATLVAKKDFFSKNLEALTNEVKMPDFNKACDFATYGYMDKKFLASDEVADRTFIMLKVAFSTLNKIVYKGKLEFVLSMTLEDNFFYNVLRVPRHEFFVMMFDKRIKLSRAATLSKFDEAIRSVDATVDLCALIEAAKPKEQEKKLDADAKEDDVVEEKDRKKKKDSKRKRQSQEEQEEDNEEKEEKPAKKQRIRFDDANCPPALSLQKVRRQLKDTIAKLKKLDDSGDKSDEAKKKREKYNTMIADKLVRIDEYEKLLKEEKAPNNASVDVVPAASEENKQEQPLPSANSAASVAVSENSQQQAPMAQLQNAASAPAAQAVIVVDDDADRSGET